MQQREVMERSKEELMEELMAKLKEDLMKGRKVTAENGKIFSRNNDLRQSWNIKDIYLLTRSDQVVTALNIFF